jgi:hypothetical protein
MKYTWCIAGAYVVIGSIAPLPTAFPDSKFVIKEEISSFIFG